MLSIQPLKSAEGSLNYYMGAANYYVNDSQAIRWLGDGAKELNLLGKPLENEQFASLLRGILPNGTQLGKIDKDGLHHRPGFDMTLSAPKSFSILLESGADPRLDTIFDDCVAWFVGEMEKEFAQTRQLIDGKIEYIDTKNLVIAAFRHPNSRANDPQTHTHLVTLNMTYCKSDDKWRSLASDMEGNKGVVEQIMKHHIYGGLKFRNKLASLTQALGHELETDADGLWEIKGVPETILSHYSKRRDAIETMMNEEGWSSAKAASIAAQRTKLDKEIVDFNQWKKDILSECHTHGFNPYELVKKSYQRDIKQTVQTIKDAIVERFYGKGHIDITRAKDAVFVALESVSQQEAVFDRRTLKKEALRYTIARQAFIDERLLDNVIEEKIASQELYQAVYPYTKKTLLTTPWQLTLESETIARIEQGKGAIEAICSKKTVIDFIKAKEQELGFSLSPSQKKAIVGFLTTTDRFIAIQGYAGTGKTTMLKLTRELAALRGYTIRGITAGSSAAEELRTKGGLNASTFDKELGQLKRQQESLNKTIFVVDEASMLSNPQGHKIIKLAEHFQTQLVVIGDKAQLPSPSSGKWFSVTQDYGIDTITMTDNLRQTDAELKESAIHASRGEIFDAVEKLTHVEARDTYEERIQYTANKWLALTPNERENTLCFAPTHKNRHDLTVILRDNLRKEGVLTGDEYTQATLKEKNLTSIMLRKAAYYSRDDVIRFNENIAHYAIKAGDYLSVQAVTKKQKDNNTLMLRRENGQSFAFKLSSLPKFKTENRDLERPIEVYKKQELHLMVGDKIQWKRNYEKMGIRNAELATLNAITQHGIEFITQGNQNVHLNKDDKALQHVDHGYALTTYAAQGKDKKNGLCLLDSKDRFATTLQNYYVATTRGIEKMTVVTDDKANLVKAITTNDSIKYSALDMVNSSTLKIHNERFKNNKTSLSLENVIQKKLVKEETWRGLEQTIAAYAHHKEQGNKAKSAIHAFNIVNNPVLYSLAKERLGLSEYTYRQDALRYETAKRFHSLTPVERARFSVVREYVRLTRELAVKSKQIKDNEVTCLSLSNRRALQELGFKRNALAGMISHELEQFKPHLTHFSIGDLNRIGLSQYNYGREHQKAITKLENLAKHSLRDGIRTKVAMYLEVQGEKKEAIASRIVRDASLSHPFVLRHAKTMKASPAVVWKSIQQDAKEHRDRLFRKGLSGDCKHLFDKIKTYKTVQSDCRESWSTQLNDVRKKEYSQSVDLITHRNRLAHEVKNHPLLPELASYFKLDLRQLTQQQGKHQYRENIQQFVACKANFRARMALINEIKNDIKGHYPFIKEAQLDIKKIGKYFRVAYRQETLLSLPESVKKDYREYLNYKKASSQVYQHWQSIHQQKAQGKLPDKSLFGEALYQGAKRDCLAYQLKQSPYLDTILFYEKGNKEKLLNQADNHHNKLRDVTNLNDLAQKLANQYRLIKESDVKKEVMAWKSNWSALERQLTAIEKNNAYAFALTALPLNTPLLTTVNHDLAYQEVKLGKNPEQSTNPIIKKVQYSSQRLDAQWINEALMVNPEPTYRVIWGEPKVQNTRQLRYEGGLIVTLKGQNKGLWYDFSEGKGGAPIQAIMAKEGLSFKEALSQAANLSGITNIEKGHPSTATSSSKGVSDLEKKNKLISAKSIWESAHPIKGTLAETYLTLHRGITLTNNKDIRYWPVGSGWKNCNDKGLLEDKVNHLPALLIAARNEKNELTGVQRIYLNSKTANKNTFMDTAKLSKGIIKGSCAVVQKGMTGARLYVAEGFETGGSIALADSKATVLCSFGVSNMKNLCETIKKFKPKEVVIAGDNDGKFAKSISAIEKTLSIYRDAKLNARVVFPDNLNECNKLDWNDVHLSKGIAEVQKQLLKNDVNLIPNNTTKPLYLSMETKTFAHIKSLKLSDSQMNSIKSISAEIDSSKRMDTQIFIPKNPEFNHSIKQEKMLPLNVKREIEIDL